MESKDDRLINESRKLQRVFHIDPNSKQCAMQQHVCGRVICSTIDQQRGVLYVGISTCECTDSQYHQQLYRRLLLPKYHSNSAYQ